ncbi:MAG: Nramp family divalent metal transporter [Thermoleophilia bacterium]|jgi:NRAMP (natural resistance-associated macrophage protein)-like metal ion transporter|nr:Nramp family divalent metal transporter [Thermoleophilia bacterium]
MTTGREKLRRRTFGRIGRTRLLIFLSVVGPGFIAANAGNDAGGITTWSVIGARYGYSLIWVLVLITPVLAVVQEMNARVGVVTGRGLAALIRENFSIKITALAILTAVVANFGTTVAEFSGIAAAGSLFGVPPYVGVPVLSILIWLLVTRGTYRKTERVLLGLGFVLVTYVAAGILAGPDWSAALHGATHPSFSSESLWLFTVIAAVGTTLTPWGQFFIQAAVVDKKVSWRQYVYTKYEIFAGSVFMTVIDFFIVLACAATLYDKGIVIESAEEAAMALEPLLGEIARYLFGLGLLAVSILAAGVLPLATAYVVCEAFGFESGLDTGFREAPVFNGIITFLIFVPALIASIPGLPLIRVIVSAQVLNGVLLPVILLFTLKLINDRSVMGDHANGRVSNAIAWTFTVALIGMSAVLLLSPFVF